MSFISKLLSNGSSSHTKKESKSAQRHKANLATAKSLRLPDPAGDGESDEDGYALHGKGARNLHSDPVPSSFKSGSFAAASRTHNDHYGLTVEVASVSGRSSDSVSGGSPASPFGRRRSGLLDPPRSPMVASGSFKNPVLTANTTTASGALASGSANLNASSSLVVVRGTEPSSVARDGGARQCWNLPWVQQRVTMCPYCHRAIHPLGTAAGAADPSNDDVMNSSAGGDEPARAGNVRKDGKSSADSLSFADGLDSDDGGDDVLLEEETETSSNTAYCHCERRASSKASHRASGLALDGSTSFRPASAPPTHKLASGSVFVLRTERSAAAALSGIIAEDSSESDSDDGKQGHRKESQTLCLVAPSTALTAQSSQHLSRQSQPSPKSKVHNWVREQERQTSPLSKKDASPKAKTSVKK